MRSCTLTVEDCFIISCSTKEEILLRCKSIIVVASLLVAPCFQTTSSAQQLWSGVLAPTRAVNWTNAGSPTIQSRTAVCATLNPGATAAQINAAIASCPAGQVVYLNAGNYSVSGQVLFNNKSNVTLRGAGPNQTFISFTAEGACNGLHADVCVINGDNNASRDPSNTATWTSNYSQGSTTITLNSVANLQVGSLLVLDQLDDSSDSGNIYICQTSGANGDCSQQGGVSNGRPNRGQNQQVTVTSISGSGPYTVGITPGLYAPNWRSSQSPGAWWSSATPVTGDGIENLSLNHSGANGSGVYGMGIQFVNATNSWVNNVRSLNDANGVSEHVEFYQSSHITVQNSYFYGSNPASEGYGASCDFSSSDNLVINNIFNHIASPLITQGCVGTVFAYNFAVDDFFGPGSWQQQDAHHSVGDMYNLFEGNETLGFTADDIHGSSAMLTFFRDYRSGRDPATANGVKTQATVPIFLLAFNRYYNVIGSVLGTQNYHTIYSTQAASATDCGSQTAAFSSVFTLGYSDQNGINYGPCANFSPTIPNDTLVATTLMRWGNYAACTGDSACNSVRFVTSEVPSSVSLYSNPVPSSQNLPNSFFLANRPSWWSASIPWPPIGPDVSGGNIANVGGHANLNPAAACYLGPMGGKTDGTSGGLTFNANQCYSASTTPPPPATGPATPQSLSGTIVQH